MLGTILHSELEKFYDPNLLVGNETADDAAVYDLGNGTAIISTTDFFMPMILLILDELPQPMPLVIFLLWAVSRLWASPF